MSRSVGGNYRCIHYFAVFRLIYLKLFGMPEMSVYVSVIVSYGYFHITFLLTVFCAYCGVLSRIFYLSDKDIKKETLLNS